MLLRNWKAMWTRLANRRKKNKALKKAIQETSNIPFFVETNISNNMYIVYANTANRARNEIQKQLPRGHSVIGVSCI